MNEPISDPQSIPRVAVVGAGYWGKNLARNFHALGALEAICDSNPETVDAALASAEGCWGTADVAEVVAAPTVDALAIATPQTDGFKGVRVLMQRRSAVQPRGATSRPNERCPSSAGEAVTV